MQTSGVVVSQWGGKEMIVIAVGFWNAYSALAGMQIAAVSFMCANWEPVQSMTSHAQLSPMHLKYTIHIYI